MSEFKQLPRESTLALLEEVKQSAQHFQDESYKAQNEIVDLKERKYVLQTAKGSISSEPSLAIIKGMIEEIEIAEVQLENRVRHCNNNHKHYVEITKAVEEALKEF